MSRTPSIANRPLFACRRWRLLLLLLPFVPLVTGCSGCVDEEVQLTDEEKEKKKEELRKKEKKPDFELRPMENLLRVDLPGLALKPGHWTAAGMTIIKNHQDFRGELLAEIVDPDGQPVSLDRAPFSVRMSRPALVAKGNKRFLEIPVFAPPEAIAYQAAPRLLSERNGVDVEPAAKEPIRLLPAHQAYFVVLAASPDQYKFLERQDAIRFPMSEFADSEQTMHYALVRPQLTSQAPPLPPALCQWSMVAYLLWDGLDPKTLRTDQQLALIDWLHWGGQLIVSGPGSFETLRGSFLDPYLPAQPAGVLTLDRAALANFTAGWPDAGRPLIVARPWTGERLAVAERPGVLPSAMVGDDPLVVEAPVGRGRVVVTAFRLSQRDLRNWGGFDGWLNCCLMKRPARTYFEDGNVQVRVNWQDGSLRWNPARISKVRFFTRDASAPKEMFADSFREFLDVRFNHLQEEEETGGFSGNFGLTAEERPPAGPGIAAWDDFSAASELARQTMQEAAGIKVPDASFVVWVLAIYATVLVPVNWAVFRAIGRVEWAWAAAPVLAMACAAVVTYVAQLDIGFARSQTQVAVLEVQSGYSRGHLTRYTALYSSLSTDYALNFTDQTSAALPFAHSQAQAAKRGLTAVDYRRARNITQETDDAEAEVSLVTLEGVQFPSNHTGMVHSEEMFELGGALTAEARGDDRFQIINNTHWTIADAAIVWLAPDPQAVEMTLNGRLSGETEEQLTAVPPLARVAWIGELPAGAAQEVLLETISTLDDGWWVGKDQIRESLANAVDPSALLDLRRLEKLGQRDVAPGELRLVGRLSQVLLGLEIRPSAAQTKAATVVVAHLTFGSPPPYETDSNARPHSNVPLEDSDEIP